MTSDDQAIRVRFESPHFGRFRSLKVIVDGENVGSVKNGAQAAFPVSPGGHSVRVKMDWAKSPIVQVPLDANETKDLTASARMPSFFSLFFRPGTIISLRVS